MDLLLENVPHMVPTTIDPLVEVDKCDPAYLFAAVIGTGTLTLAQCFREVTKNFMLHSDDASSITGIGIACAIEHAVLQFTHQAQPGPNAQSDIESMQFYAKMISNIVTDYQVLLDTRRSHDCVANRSPEVIEKGWAALLANKADLEKFEGMHSSDTYLETRKIFLPQGATLILHYWQRELNEFLTKLERVSKDPPRIVAQRALSSRLHNMPRVAKSGSGIFDNFDITTHSNLPAPVSSGSASSVQRESIPELAALLPKVLRKGVESPNIWVQTCICYTSVLTVDERKKGLNGILWRLGRL